MTSAIWHERAEKRKAMMDALCWNDGMGMYYDYDTRLEQQSLYKTVTSLWVLWAGCASEAQAEMRKGHVTDCGAVQMPGPEVCHFLRVLLSGG